MVTRTARSHFHLSRNSKYVNWETFFFSLADPRDVRRGLFCTLSAQRPGAFVVTGVSAMFSGAEGPRGQDGDFFAATAHSSIFYLICGSLKHASRQR